MPWHHKINPILLNYLLFYLSNCDFNLPVCSTASIETARIINLSDTHFCISLSVAALMTWFATVW